MSTATNKATLRRWFEGWNTRDLSVLEALVDELYTADFTIHDNVQPGASVGRGGEQTAK